LSLPIAPAGDFRDVDNDDTEDTGIQFYVPAITDNLWGDPYIIERDGFFLGYASMVYSDDAATLSEIEGGKALVWAPDDQQGFPGGYGEDGFVFTEDDPIVRLPQGWTVVDMSEDTFTFDRSATATVDLLEAESAELDDFSELSYTEAFNAMIDLFTEEYAFTEVKEIDWEEKRAEFLPLVEEAEANDDQAAFETALRLFAWSIPDGHMFGPFDGAAFNEAISGGLGIAIRELDDGRVIVTFLTPGSSADEEGIELRAEILEINGMPIDDAISEVVPWSSPFSTEHVLRLQQLRYVTRYPLGTEVEITYQNPGDAEPTTTTLATTPERESFASSSFNVGRTGTEYPVEFEILDSGFGYVKIFTFSDDLPLTVELWDRAIQTFNAAGVPGIIIDMRQNGGGFSAVGYQMASYLFDDDYVIEIDSFYDDSIEGFFIYEENPSRLSPPAPELRYEGEVVVLIEPSCSSACEYVTRAMTINDRAEVVGFYPTNGIGGGWAPILLPGDIQMPNITRPSYDVDLNLIIEGTGVEPTVRVPVTEETLFTEPGEDVLLDRGVELLSGMLTFDTQMMTTVEVGDTISGGFEPGMRDQYMLDVSTGDSIIVELRSAVGIDPVLRVYVEGDAEPVAINDNVTGAETRSARIEIFDIPADFTFIIEATTVRDAGDGAYIMTITEPEASEEEAEPMESAATEEPMMDATEEAMPGATEEMTTATEEAMMATEEPEMDATEEPMVEEATDEPEAEATEEMAATEEA
ncbi:MAG: S41 family peptidase, partial [Chloroflexota bacterium]